jgi:hypothetical protein
MQHSASETIGTLEKSASSYVERGRPLTIGHEQARLVKESRHLKKTNGSLKEDYLNANLKNDIGINLDGVPEKPSTPESFNFAFPGFH